MKFFKGKTIINVGVVVTFYLRKTPLFLVMILSLLYAMFIVLDVEK